MINGPSKNLSWKELACKDGTPYPEEWRNNRAIQLAEVFEYIREQWNKPIVVVSAYRTKSWNIKIGGAKGSQHLEGRALDLKPPQGVSINEFYNTIRSLVNVTAIRGLGRYPTFVHVDVRDVNKLVVWSSSAAKDTSTNA